MWHVAFLNIPSTLHGLKYLHTMPGRYMYVQFVEKVTHSGISDKILTNLIIDDGQQKVIGCNIK